MTIPPEFDPPITCDSPESCGKIMGECMALAHLRNELAKNLPDMRDAIAGLIRTSTCTCPAFIALLEQVRGYKKYFPE